MYECFPSFIVKLLHVLLFTGRKDRTTLRVEKQGLLVIASSCRLKAEEVLSSAEAALQMFPLRQDVASSEISFWQKIYFFLLLNMNFFLCKESKGI